VGGRLPTMHACMNGEGFDKIVVRRGASFKRYRESMHGMRATLKIRVATAFAGV
jgi:hypothetical protein